MTSDTRLPSMPARARAASIATFPSAGAGNEDSVPFNEPTGVRAAPTMTMSSCIDFSSAATTRAPRVAAVFSANRWCQRREAQQNKYSVMAKNQEPVTIKKYANRRLYNTGTSPYVTLEDLAVMVKQGD